MEKLLCFCLKGQGVHFYQIGSFKYTSLGMCVSLPKHLLLHEIHHRIERGSENCSLAGIRTRHHQPKKRQQVFVRLTWVGLADVIFLSQFWVISFCFRRLFCANNMRTDVPYLLHGNHLDGGDGSSKCPWRTPMCQAQ